MSSKATLREAVAAAREELRMTREALRKAHDDGSRLGVALADERAKNKNLTKSVQDSARLNAELIREKAKAEALGISVWSAYRSPGAPICVSTPDDTKKGLSVNIYKSDGIIVGVSIHERERGSKVGGAGLVGYEDD